MRLKISLLTLKGKNPFITMVLLHIVLGMLFVIFLDLLSGKWNGRPENPWPLHLPDLTTCIAPLGISITYFQGSE